MGIKRSVGASGALPSNYTTGISETTTYGDQEHVAGTTLQSFIWSWSDHFMNLSDPENASNFETSVTESMNESMDESGVFTSQDPTSSDLNLTAPAVPTAGYNDEIPVRFIVYTILHALVIVIGLLTNILILMVMMRRNTRRQQMAVFLIPLALFDTIKLISDVHLFGLIQLIPNAFDISTYSTLCCQIFGAVAIASSCTSSWILIVMTAERAMAVSDPIKFKKQWTKKMSVLMVLIPILVIALLSVPTAWANKIMMDPLLGSPVCMVKEGRATRIMIIVDSLVYSIIPCIALFILNIIIIKGLSAKNDVLEHDVKASKNIQERRLAITVLSISIAFLLSVSPFGFYQIYFVSPYADKINHIWPEITLLSSLNHSLNFFFYIIGGKRFRTEFGNMVCCFCGILNTWRNSESF